MLWVFSIETIRSWLNPIENHRVIDEIIEEDKKEREERWELGGPAEQ